MSTELIERGYFQVLDRLFSLYDTSSLRLQDSFNLGHIVFRADNPQVRHAVYTVHGERCYQCKKPIAMTEFDVDHVIPKWLANEPEKLEEVLKELGLSADFELESFENWLPSCKPCNNDKGEIVWEPSLAVQRVLQKARDKAGDARKHAQAIVDNKALAKAVNVIQRFREQGEPMPLTVLNQLRPLLLMQVLGRGTRELGDPIRISTNFVVPLVDFLSQGELLTILRGPFGIGGGPTNPSNALRCANCGFAAWNGARCVVCGEMSDD